MNKFVLNALAIGALSSTLILAQGPRERTPPDQATMVAHRVSRLTTSLSLTTAQQAQATTIFTNAQTSLASSMNAMHTARAALKVAVENNDQNGILAQANQIGSLTAQQVEAQSKAEAAFYATLTADQKTAYAAAGPGHMGPGFGGPGGPGPNGFGGRGARSQTQQ